MTDFSGWQEIEEDDLYPLTETDPLKVLSTTRDVVEQGEQVWINKDQINLLCEQWTQEVVGKASTPQWYNQYHFHDGTERTVNWLLLLDALNFCFWAEKDQPRWTIEYQGETLNGYLAEAAALSRAVEEGLPIWDAEYLSTISSDTIAHIFRGNQSIPLFEQRVAHTREIGRVLLERYDGQFSHAIEQSGRNAVKLARLLAEDFSSFQDSALYRNRPVKFLKRAQICVADLHNSFKGQQWGDLADLDQLTAFADYKLPQVLRHYNVLEYHPTLAERIDQQDLIEAGSEEEIEIRAATIWACELLRRAMQQQGQSINAAQIDQRLWLMGQDATAMRPYHRARTIYY